MASSLVAVEIAVPRVANVKAKTLQRVKTASPERYMFNIRVTSHDIAHIRALRPAPKTMNVR